MGHLPKLIEDLALILIVGAMVTLLFRRIRQPLVLGYILAGFLVGPHLSIFPTVADMENVETLAEIGVIFLLFSLGLEFSFKKLMRIGGTASITAGIEIVFITLAGYITGKLMGWTTMDCLFLGGMLASSSTTIIIRAFDELGVKTKQFARVVFGVLVVEDIVVILLMVILSTVAVTRTIEGTQLFLTITRLLFFLILWFIAGIFILPTFLKKVKTLLDEETLLILAIGLCLGMVVLATQVGFSAELGAFIMGSILAETTKAEKVEHLIKPVKDLFGAVFFVSVGMLIDPMAIKEYGWAVILVTLLTLFGKFFSTAAGALISGQTLKQSVQVGMSMAQIGEFAFIVATLGLSLGVISDFLFPVAVGASAITTFTTPYLIRYSGKAYDIIVRMLPSRWVSALDRYAYSTQVTQVEGAWQVAAKSYVNIIMINAIVLVAILLLSVRFLLPLLIDWSESEILGRSIALVLTLLVSLPFLWGLMAKRPGNMTYRELWLNRSGSYGALRIIDILRIIGGVLVIGFIIDQFFSTLVSLIALPVIIGMLLLWSNKIQDLYHRLEDRFLANLNSRETAAMANLTSEKRLHQKFTSSLKLSAWDAHMVDLKVDPQAYSVGKTLQELEWREKFGVNVAYIRRGDKLIYAPDRNQKIYPFDQLGIIATDEQIQLFKPSFDICESVEPAEPHVDDIVLQKIQVDDSNQLAGQTIRNSEIREKTKGLVIGIERGIERMINPRSDIRFEEGDIVWLVGERHKIHDLFSIMAPVHEQ